VWLNTETRRVLERQEMNETKNNTPSVCVCVCVYRDMNNKFMKSKKKKIELEEQK
jgi:hypothetical protein